MKPVSLWIRLIVVIAVVVCLLPTEGTQAQAVGTLTRISVDSDGGVSDGASSEPVISANGQYVAFTSAATDLVSGDTNGATDVFVRNLLSGETVLLSRSTDGDIGDGRSYSPAISDTGRYVVFISFATNLVAGDTNAIDDVFWVDRDTDDDGIFDETGNTAVARVSVSSDGSQITMEWEGPYYSSPSVSSDGRYVVFSSSANNLVSGDVDYQDDVFLHDRLTGAIQRIPVDRDANGATESARYSSISADGRYVGLISGNQTLLYDRDTDVNGEYDETGTTAFQVVSVSTSGVESNGTTSWEYSSPLSFSEDGQWVAFASNATNLVEFSLSSGYHAYLHNLLTGETSLIAYNSSSVKENGRSWHPSLSSDARYITFVSEAWNLDNDANMTADIFIRDRQEGKTYRIGNVETNGVSDTPSISSDGNSIAFYSAASNMITTDTDTNEVSDIFLFESTPNTMSLGFASSKNRIAQVPQVFNLSMSSSTKLPITYTWSADGQTTITHANVTSLTDSATFTWSDAGTHTVTAQASNIDGTVEKSITFSLGDPITLDFSADVIQGGAPLTVTFTNTTNSSITCDNLWNSNCRYLWDFGDSSTGGSTPVNATTTHTYTAAGTYQVSLQLIYMAPNTWYDLTLTKEAYIVVDNSTQALFTVDYSVGAAPLAVQFTDTSGGSPTTWSWDFDDGTSSTDQHPSHVYQNPGLYDVTLTASGANGTDTMTETITVYNPIVAGFEMDVSEGIAPLTVSFTNTSTGEDPTSGETLSYDWFFQYGSTSTEQNPTSHTFDVYGTYPVQLTVSTSYGSDTYTDYVSVYQPVSASFSADYYSGTAPLTVQFNNTTSGDADTWLWDFGDGVTSTTSNPSHTFQTNGTYTVQLTASGKGGSDSATQTINVYVPVVAGFTKDASTGPIPLMVQFTNTSTGDYTSLSWNFGDGKSSTATNPSHTFSTKGTYNVILTATGPGGTDTETQTITVYTPSSAAFHSDVTAGGAPLDVNFTNDSSGDYTSSLWNFGDGSDTVSTASPSHTFSDPGTYTVRLTVDGPGGTSYIEHDIEVIAPPETGFSASAIRGLAPLEVTFTNLSTGYTSFFWDFGDGSQLITDQASPTHTYTQKGTYTATLTTTGPGGTTYHTQTIQVFAQVQAVFTANHQSGRIPIEIQFTSASTGDYDTLTWNFGDGSSATGSSVTHTYTQSGAYTVTLTASGDGGTDTEQISITLSKSVAASFTADRTVTTAGQSIRFTNTSAGPSMSCLWNFGDGTTSTSCSPNHTYSKSGAFTVTLTVTSAYDTDTAQSVDYITIQNAVFIPLIIR